MSKQTDSIFLNEALAHTRALLNSQALVKERKLRVAGHLMAFGD